MVHLQKTSFSKDPVPKVRDFFASDGSTDTLPDLDIEEVRKALQMRWDIFSAFPPALQDALKDGNLETVNKVLGDMSVVEAESVVQALDMGGILSFEEGGIRDETGQASEA